MERRDRERVAGAQRQDVVAMGRIGSRVQRRGCICRRRQVANAGLVC